MKINEHIYAIKNLLSAGPVTDDFKFSNELIAHFLEVTRAILTEQKADKYRFISEQSFQSVCLHLQLSSFHNCCDGPTDLCKVLRSSIKIPKFLNTRWGAFIKVTDLVGNVIPRITFTQDKYSKFSRTKKHKVGWFIHDGYLYIINNTDLELVLLTGLFNKPTEIEAINCSNNTTISTCPEPFTTEFPIDSDLVEPMYKKTLDFLLRATGIPQDNENDSRDIQVLSK